MILISNKSKNIAKEGSQTWVEFFRLTWPLSTYSSPHSDLNAPPFLLPLSLIPISICSLILRITYQLNLEHYFLQTVSKYGASLSFQPKS